MRFQQLIDRSRLEALRDDEAQDVTATLDLALAASGLEQMIVDHRPRLSSENGASNVAEDLAVWLKRQKIEHVRSSPYHPQTQGKIARWHQTLKNRILLEHYYLPGDLERRVAAFVAQYNHARHHESLGISRPPTSTSDGRRPFSSNAKGSNDKQSPIVARSSNCKPHNLNRRRSRASLLEAGQYVSNHLTTDSRRLRLEQCRLNRRCVPLC